MHFYLKSDIPHLKNKTTTPKQQQQNKQKPKKNPKNRDKKTPNKTKETNSKQPRQRIPHTCNRL